MSKAIDQHNGFHDKNWHENIVEKSLKTASNGSLFLLQTAIFDIIKSSADGKDKFDAVLETVRYAFDFDAAFFFAMPDQTLENALFVSTDESIEKSDIHTAITHFGTSGMGGAIPISKSPVGDKYDYQNGFFQFVSKEPTDRLRKGILVGLSNKRDNLVEHELLSLQAIAPSFGLLSDVLIADQQLIEANERFTSLSNSLPGVVYQRVVRPNGEIRYTYVSDSAIDIFGISAEEILTNPKALFDSYAPEYRDQFRERLIQASKDMTKWDVEASIIMPDGTIRYTHAVATPVKQSDGSVLWTGVILDASRIKAAEQEAAEAADTTRRNIVESLGQGFVMFDKEDKLTLFNDTFTQFFAKNNMKAHEGQTYEDFVTNEIRASYPEQISVKRINGMSQERIEAHNESRSYNAEYHMKDDRWLQVNEHVTSDGNTVIVYTDVTAIKVREAKIQHMAMHDALTGLPNRMLFRDRGRQAIRDAKRYQTNTAILALDLDNFKTVNDTLGHPAGDKLLQEVTRRISANVRETDTLARLGGDEFAIVMRDIDDLSNIENISKRVIEALALPVDLDGNQVIVGVSIGIAVCDNETIDHDELLKNADLALYRAKADGKNTFRFFEKSMDELTRARRRMESDLRTALNESHLELHFQPQVNVKRREISGFEALVRWNHPERGTVSPNDFITIAEETGLINQLGEWVLYNACKCAAGWSKPSKIAVNLSPAQFTKSDIVDYVEKVLEKTGLDPTRLELEITEGLLLHNTADTLDKLYRLKGLGISIAMDDFGTGYSSLGNLRSFPFDRIKIDKSFVLNLETNPESAAIIKAVVGLGKSLGMNTTAEGVETLRQLQHLQVEGCSEIQGFYYSHARPNSEVEQLLSGKVDGFNSLGLNELVF